MQNDNFKNFPIISFTVPAPPLFDTKKEEVALQDALTSLPRCARDCLQMYVQTDIINNFKNIIFKK